jgi:hypothetical protein
MVELVDRKVDVGLGDAEAAGVDLQADGEIQRGHTVNAEYLETGRVRDEIVDGIID